MLQVSGKFCQIAWLQVAIHRKLHGAAPAKKKTKSTKKITERRSQGRIMLSLDLHLSIARGAPADSIMALKRKGANQLHNLLVALRVWSCCGEA
jgi:hypothetical protein